MRLQFCCLEKKRKKKEEIGKGDTESFKKHQNVSISVYLNTVLIILNAPQLLYFEKVGYLEPKL